jgi:hypothetical protein
MKNKVLTFLIVCAFFDFTYGQRKSPDISQDIYTFELIGNVRNLEQIEYSAIDLFGDIKKDSFLNKFLCNFDIAGNLINFSSYNFYRNKERYNGGYIWEYNNDGKPIQLLEKNLDGSVFKSSYLYDSSKRLIESEHFDVKNRLTGKEKFKYDEKGNNLESKFYGEDGALNEVYVFAYDLNGNCIQEERLNRGSYLAKKYTFKYDVKGNLIEEYLIDKGSGSSYPSGDRSKKVIEYNLSGKKVKTTYYKAIGENSLKLFQEIMYDEKGNEILSNFYSNSFNRHLDNSRPSIFVYEYIYDNLGNWIKKVEFVNYEPVRIIERSISYY